MPTDTPWVFVFGAVFFAALIQSTTGIGFGLITMPFLLIALSGSTAVQITIVLSLVMSIVLCVRSYQDCDARVLRILIFGGAVGLPIGLFAFRSVDPVGLKLLAAAVVLLFAISIATWSQAGLPQRRFRMNLHATKQILPSYSPSRIRTSYDGSMLMTWHRVPLGTSQACPEAIIFRRPSSSLARCNCSARSRFCLVDAT